MLVPGWPSRSTTSRSSTPPTSRWPRSRGALRRSRGRRLHRVHGVDAGARRTTPLKTMDDEGAHAGHARPGLDHRGHGARDVPRREAAAAGEREPPPVRRARRHDPLSGRGALLSRERLCAGRRHRGQFGGQDAGPTRAARSSCSRGRSRSSSSSCRPRCPSTSSKRIRDALLTLRDSKPGRDELDAVGYKGFVAPNPEVESSTIAWLGFIEKPDSERLH